MPMRFAYTAPMHDDSRYQIQVEVRPRFLDDPAAALQGRYAFAYDIRILNTGDIGARLVARHWEIDHGNGRIERVDGEGVVGEQPWLRPGEDFRYTSAVLLETGDGLMQGHYDLVADDGTSFTAEIAAFALATPRTLH